MALRAQSAGELQALLGELEPHLLDVDGASPLGLPPAAGRVLLVSCGVGAPREDDLTLLQQARREGFAPALYTLNVRLDPRLGRRVRQAGVPHRGFDVFDELSMTSSGRGRREDETYVVVDPGFYSLHAEVSKVSWKKERRDTNPNEG